jgi:UDP-4-amino-4-deoxy-L-arabinose formyltransferase/UDP-glucuronic acid dehydrogenase (UDP-4-keto-hexauronic acid decarboxylating)
VNVVLVAEEAAGIRVLRRLAALDHRLVAVFTAPQTRGGGATVAGVAASLGVPVRPSRDVRDRSLADWIRANGVDLLLNVHSLYLIAGEVVCAPRIGSFNLHPGPLPERAGLNVPSWAIYEGHRVHGVTMHWMEPEIDTGAIAYETRFEIEDDATGISLSLRCVREGLTLVDALLNDAARGAVPSQPQDLRLRRYYSRDVPQDGQLHWARKAREIDAFVRACDYFPFASPWGHPVCRFDGCEIAVLKTERTGKPAGAEPGTVGRHDGPTVRIAAADEWVTVRRVGVDGTVTDAAAVLAPGMVATGAVV